VVNRWDGRGRGVESNLSEEPLGVRVETVNSSLDLSGSGSKLESNGTISDSGFEGGDGLKERRRERKKKAKESATRRTKLEDVETREGKLETKLTVTPES